MTRVINVKKDPMELIFEGIEMQKWNILLTGWWEKLGHLSSYNICFKSYGH